MTRGRRARRGARPFVGLLLTGALLVLTGCASMVDPIERLGRKAAERMGTRPAPAAGTRPHAAPGPSAAPPERPVPGKPQGARRTPDRSRHGVSNWHSA